MQTSTPLLSTPQCLNLRKSVLLNVTNTSPSVRRLSNVSQQTPRNQILIDDDLERNQRRSEADLHKRVSNIVPQTPTQLNEKEVRDHFQICLKMFAENKISAKNAWNLKIIDYMRAVITFKGQAKDSLHVAGTSLDVSTKVYGIRVDDIHSDGLKLASNMARVNTQSDEQNEQDEDGPDDETKQKGPKKKKAKLSGQRITITKDPKSLLSNIKKMESVFFQTRIDLEASSTDNLFTNKLTIHPSGYKFMLLSQEHAWTSYDNFVHQSSNKSHPMEILELGNIQICAQFSNFEIDEWDPNNEKEMLSTNKTMTDELVFDADGIPIPELDGSVHDLFANNVAAEADNYGSSDEEVNSVGQTAFKNRTVAHIVDFRPNENEACDNEYNYSNFIKLIDNKHITQIWAGPSYWKLKYIKPTVSRFSGQGEKPTTKSARKVRNQPTLIDFTTEDCNLTKTFIQKLKRNIAYDNPYRCTLPPVFLDANSKNAPLILKPVYLEIIHGSKKDKVIDKEMEPYNYENPDDSQYCVENGVRLILNIFIFHTFLKLDDDNHSGDEGVIASEDVFGVQQNFGENLVDAPTLVPNNYIPYALQAKKMDMKKLKTSIWKSLVSKTVNEDVPDEDMYQKEVQPMKFSHLLQHLPKRLTDKMKSELSCPLAFVALLHLANEQNLQFQSEGLSNFSIKQ